MVIAPILQRVPFMRTRPHWLIFLFSLFVTLMLLPWTRQTWGLQGDEPHYLLATHSLVVDGDLDLANNYAQGDIALFYKGQIDQHVRTGLDGGSYLSHDVGLPILIAPAYAIAGRTGVSIFLAVVSALIAVNVYLLAYQVTSDADEARRHEAALVAWLLLSLTPLLSIYTFLIYPEMVGALAVIWCMRQMMIVSQSNHNFVGVAGIATAAAMLPWLSARFIPIALLIVLLGVWKWRDRRSWVLGMSTVVILSLVGYLVTNAWMSAGGSGTVDFDGGVIVQGFRTFSFERLLRGLTGWWLDQQRGLLIYSPVIVVALLGLPALWRRFRWRGALLMTPFLIVLSSAAVWGGFWVAWEVSARYTVVGLPLFAAPLALAWVHLRAQRMHLRKMIFYGIILFTFTVGVLNTMLILRIPGEAAYRGSVVLNYNRRLPVDLRGILPAMGSGTRIDPYPNAHTTIAIDGGRQVWRSARGKEGVVLESQLENLTVGSYQLSFEARALNIAADDAQLLTVEVIAGTTDVLLHHELYASDVMPASVYHSISLPFDNPIYDKWTYPIYVRVSSTGLAEVSLSALEVTVEPLQLWGKIALWSGVIIVSVVAFNWRGEVDQ